MNYRYVTLYTLLILSVFELFFTSCIKDSNLNAFSDSLKIARVYQPNGTVGKEAIIESILPNQNFGNSIHIALFSWTNGGSFNSARALIEFDLSDISIQKKISSARLSLYWISYNNLTEQTGDNSFSIYRITQEWAENSVTWNNQPPTSTLHKVTVPKSIKTNQSYIDIDVTDLVQDMIAYPQESHGFMLKLDEEFPYKLVILASSDYSLSTKRPKLVVYY